MRIGLDEVVEAPGVFSSSGVGRWFARAVEQGAQAFGECVTLSAVVGGYLGMVVAVPTLASPPTYLTEGLHSPRADIGMADTFARMHALLEEVQAKTPSLLSKGLAPLSVASSSPEDVAKWAARLAGEDDDLIG